MFPMTYFYWSDMFNAGLLLPCGISTFTLDLDCFLRRYKNVEDFLLLSVLRHATSNVCERNDGNQTPGGGGGHGGASEVSFPAT